MASSISLTNTPLSLSHSRFDRHHHHAPPFIVSPATLTSKRRCLHFSRCVAGPQLRTSQSATLAFSTVTNSVPAKSGTYTVGDFMTRKDDLHVVKTTTTVDEALEALVENGITGFPVVEDNWKLVGVISDYDLLVLNSVSGGSQIETNFFPDVDSSWKTFNEIQKLLVKTHGKVVSDLMTPNPLVVHETTNLEAAARLLLETKYHRLPVVDSDGKLVGVITRGNIVRAALQIRYASQKSTGIPGM